MYSSIVFDRRNVGDIWLHEGFACYKEWIWSEASGNGTVRQSIPAVAVPYW